MQRLGPASTLTSTVRKGRSTGRGRLLLLCALPALLVSGPAAAKSDAQWLAEHLALDAGGTVGWRVAWAEQKNPGFHFLGGGGEFNIGLEFTSGFGFLLGTRAMFGKNLGPSGGDVFADVTGQVVGQFRLSDWVRIGLGANVGRFFPCCDGQEAPDSSSLLAGGFLRIGFDYLPRNTNLLRGLSLWLRIGIDGHPGIPIDSRLPTTSMNIALSSGLRL